LDSRVTRDEHEARELFAEKYGVGRGEANLRIERAVIGGDWGANGYTTMAQADELGAHLELAPGKTLLDVGAGRGWPGLYLAATSGCDVVLSDLPHEGLVLARRRAAAEGMTMRVRYLVASASHLPLRAGGVDAVVASDVLC
jgi:2-polyprenyl-3-methyl-5-hydroxy-6-metoxy-1,4-benzoquinol methylase